MAGHEDKSKVRKVEYDVASHRNGTRLWAKNRRSGLSVAGPTTAPPKRFSDLFKQVS